MQSPDGRHSSINLLEHVEIFEELFHHELENESGWESKLAMKRDFAEGLMTNSTLASDATIASDHRSSTSYDRNLRKNSRSMLDTADISLAVGC